MCLAELFEQLFDGKFFIIRSVICCQIFSGIHKSLNYQFLKNVRIPIRYRLFGVITSKLSSLQPNTTINIRAPTPCDKIWHHGSGSETLKYNMRPKLLLAMTNSHPLTSPVQERPSSYEHRPSPPKISQTKQCLWSF